MYAVNSPFTSLNANPKRLRLLIRPKRENGSVTVNDQELRGIDNEDIFCFARLHHSTGQRAWQQGVET